MSTPSTPFQREQKKDSVICTKSLPEHIAEHVGHGQPSLAQSTMRSLPGWQISDEAAAAAVARMSFRSAAFSRLSTLHPHCEFASVKADTNASACSAAIALTAAPAPPHVVPAETLYNSVAMHPQHKTLLRVPLGDSV